MRNKIIALVCIWLLGTLTAVAQTQNAIPVIVTFQADPAAFTVDAAESGDTDVTFSWQVINMPDDARLVLHGRSLGGWVLAIPEDQPLEASGSATLMVQHPLDFEPPIYRLSLVDAAGQLLDERLLVLPYEVVPDVEPQIDLFTANNPTLSGEALSDGSARVSVSWAVSNRLPTSNLVFDQIVNGGEAVPVELPRDNLWIASRGDGMVAPVAPSSGSVVNLRLRVVDVLSGEIYAESEVEVLVAGTIEVVPSATPEPSPVPEDAEGDTTADTTPQPTPVPVNCSFSALDVPLTGRPGDGCDVYWNASTATETRVLDFSISNPNPVPGIPVTLSWEIEGAQFALLEIYDPRQLAQGGLPEPALAFYDGLPTSGSTTVNLPASLPAGVRIVLWAANLSTEARSPSFLYDRLAYRIIDTGAAQALSSNAEITAFIALPTTAAPGSEVTLSWSLTGADAALIELYDRATNTLAGTFDGLPIIGSANVVIPASFTQGARFVLWATDEAGDGTYIRLVEAETQVTTE
ncbi:MAG: hypothetical protein CL610_23730 [Anaerolineaceae bacterium]|nr:hypothetical protein [Anaerolineaceae bacterium]